MNTPAMQSSQIFAVNGDGLLAINFITSGVGVLGIGVSQVGTPIDTVLRVPPSFIKLDTLGGIAIGEVVTQAVSSIVQGFNQANAFVSANILRASAADSLNATTTNGLYTASLNYGFNGTDATGLDRLRTISLANSNNAVVPTGVQIVERAVNWSQAVEAAVTVQATTTKAAVANQRHVCTAIGGSLVGVAAIAAPLYLRLRDGASGAGTILWSHAFVVPLGTAANFMVTGLNIVGSTNTAMTLEWSAAPGATNFQTASMSGRTVA